jgi:hypothetical protein
MRDTSSCSFVRTPHGVGKAQDGAWGLAGREHLEGIQDESALQEFVPGNPQRQTKGKKGQPDGAWRAYLLRGRCQQQVEADRADACLFDGTRDQSN